MIWLSRQVLRCPRCCRLVQRHNLSPLELPGISSGGGLGITTWLPKHTVGDAAGHKSDQVSIIRLDNKAYSLTTVPLHSVHSVYSSDWCVEVTVMADASRQANLQHRLGMLQQAIKPAITQLTLRSVSHGARQLPTGRAPLTCWAAPGSRTHQTGVPCHSGRTAQHGVQNRTLQGEEESGIHTRESPDCVCSDGKG